MTRQTPQPIEHRTLAVSNRLAREVARTPGLILDPPYQRGSVWTTDQRMDLIRSWLAGVPVPAVTLSLRDEGYDGVAVVDGRQRIETAQAWFASDLAVPASWFPADRVASTVQTDDGPYITYAGLTEVGQRLFANRAVLPVIETHLDSVAQEAELYVLLERSGTTHTEQDMIRAQALAVPRT